MSTTVCLMQRYLGLALNAQLVPCRHPSLVWQGLWATWMNICESLIMAPLTRGQAGYCRKCVSFPVNSCRMYGNRSQNYAPPIRVTHVVSVESLMLALTSCTLCIPLFTPFPESHKASCTIISAPETAVCADESSSANRPRANLPALSYTWTPLSQ